MNRFIIRVNERFVSIVDLSQHLMNVSSAEIAKFFKSKGVKIPSTVLRRVYSEVLNERGTMSHIQRVCSAEFNKLMEDYENLSIYQYANLVETASLVIDGKLIKHKFFMVLFEDVESYKIGDDDIIELLKKSINPQYQAEDTAMDFYVSIRPIMHDEDNFLDGLETEKAVSVISKVSTVSDIVQFSKIIGVELPEQITKDIFLERLFKMLKEKGVYNLKLAHTLSAIEFHKLELFAIDNNFKIVSEVEKKIMVDFILEYIKKQQEEIDAEFAGGVVVTTSPLDLLREANVDVSKAQIDEAAKQLGLDFGAISNDVSLPDVKDIPGSAKQNSVLEELDIDNTKEATETNVSSASVNEVINDDPVEDSLDDDFDTQSSDDVDVELGDLDDDDLDLDFDF